MTQRVSGNVFVADLEGKLEACSCAEVSVRTGNVSVSADGVHVGGVEVQALRTDESGHYSAVIDSDESLTVVARCGSGPWQIHGTYCCGAEPNAPMMIVAAGPDSDTANADSDVTLPYGDTLYFYSADGSILFAIEPGSAKVNAVVSPLFASGLERTKITDIDFKPTGNPAEFTVEVEWLDADGATHTTQDPTPVTLSLGNTSNHLALSTALDFGAPSQPGGAPAGISGDKLVVRYSNGLGFLTYDDAIPAPLGPWVLDFFHSSNDVRSTFSRETGNFDFSASPPGAVQNAPVSPVVGSTHTNYYDNGIITYTWFEPGGWDSNAAVGVHFPVGLTTQDIQDAQLINTDHVCFEELVPGDLLLDQLEASTGFYEGYADLTDFQLNVSVPIARWVATSSGEITNLRLLVEQLQSSNAGGLATFTVSNATQSVAPASFGGNWGLAGSTFGNGPAVWDLFSPTALIVEEGDEIVVELAVNNGNSWAIHSVAPAGDDAEWLPGFQSDVPAIGFTGNVLEDRGALAKQIGPDGAATYVDSDGVVVDASSFNEKPCQLSDAEAAAVAEMIADADRWTQNIECKANEVGFKGAFPSVVSPAVGVALPQVLEWTPTAETPTTAITIALEDDGSTVTTHAIELAITADGVLDETRTATLQPGFQQVLDFGAYTFEAGVAYTLGLSTVDGPVVMTGYPTALPMTFQAATTPVSYPSVTISAPGDERYRVITRDDDSVIAFDESTGDIVPVDPTWVDCPTVVSIDEVAGLREALEPVLCPQSGIVAVGGALESGFPTNGEPGTIVPPAETIGLNFGTNGTIRETPVQFYGRLPNHRIDALLRVVRLSAGGGGITLNTNGIFGNTSGASDYTVELVFADGILYRTEMHISSAGGAENFIFTNPVTEYEAGSGGPALVLPYVGSWTNGNDGDPSGFGFDAANSLLIRSNGTAGAGAGFSLSLRDVPLFVEQTACERSSELFDYLSQEIENAGGQAGSITVVSS